MSRLYETVIVLTTGAYTHACVAAASAGEAVTMASHAVLSRSWSEKGVRLALKMRVAPCIPVGMQR